MQVSPVGFEKAKSHYVVPEQQLPGADNLTLLSFIRPVAAKQGLIIAGRLFPQHTFPPFLLLPASCSAITGTRAANITSNTQLRNYTNTQLHNYTNKQIHKHTNTKNTLCCSSLACQMLSPHWHWRHKQQDLANTPFLSLGKDNRRQMSFAVN